MKIVRKEVFGTLLWEVRSVYCGGAVAGRGGQLAFQIGIEGSSQLRLDRDIDEELVGTDYRFGDSHHLGQ